MPLVPTFGLGGTEQQISVNKPGLQSQFQDGQRYTERPSLKKQKKKKGRKEASKQHGPPGRDRQRRTRRHTHRPRVVCPRLQEENIGPPAWDFVEPGRQAL